MTTERKENTCRVCLRSDVVEKCISLFEKYKDSTISNYIISIANVSIEKEDGLPSKICPDCLLLLDSAVNFKQKCESSHTFLLNTEIKKLSDCSTEIELDLGLVKKEEAVDIEIDFLNDNLLKGLEDCNDIGNESDIVRTDEKLTFKSKAIDLKLICHDCGGSFKSKCKLRVHWKKVHLPEALICKLCKRTFSSYKAFNRHIKNKKKACVSTSNMRVEGFGKSRVFHCKECSYSSRRVKDMQSHLVIHSGEKPFVCTVCSKGFSQQASVQCHMETVHKMYKLEITCQYCGKHVKGRGSIYRHLKQHTAPRVQCDICKRMLKSKESLRNHLIRHEGVKSYTCEMCASSFYTLAELSNHRRFTHSKDKERYKCDKCTYKARRSETIKKHRAKHTDSNVPCLVCGMFLDNMQKLAVHQKRHFAEKKFTCPHCENKFFKKESLYKHIRAKHRCTMLVNRSVAIKKDTLMKYDDVETVSVKSENSKIALK